MRVKGEIESALANAALKFLYIENIKNNQVPEGIEYIIVPEKVFEDQRIKDTLDAILHPETGNPHLKIVAAFDNSAYQMRNNFKVPKSVRHLIILGNRINKIGNGFLSGCSGLQTIDLTSLLNVRSIGNTFLYGCAALQTIDLTSFSNIREIGDHFLASSGLKGVALTPFSNVAAIGNYFLAYCGRLQTIDLTTLSTVTSIGDHFLCYCGRLQTIDLAPLLNVTLVGSHFLENCTAVENIDLTPLSKITGIKNNFLAGCSALRNVDLTPLMNVTLIEDFFLANCIGLQAIIATSFSQVISIGNYFLASCRKLQSVDVGSLSEIISVGDFFLDNCREISHIKISKKLYNLLIQKDPNFFDQFLKLQQNQILIADMQLSFSQRKVSEIYSNWELLYSATWEDIRKKYHNLLEDPNKTREQRLEIIKQLEFLEGEYHRGNLPYQQSQRQPYAPVAQARIKPGALAAAPAASPGRAANIATFQPKMPIEVQAAAALAQSARTEKINSKDKALAVLGVQPTADMTKAQLLDAYRKAVASATAKRDRTLMQKLMNAAEYLDI